MSMLAEPRRKQRIGPNPRGKFFTEDEDNRGRNMMQKMGWSNGDGLGVDRQGIREPIRPKIQTDAKGLGFDVKTDPWVSHNDDFDEVLRNLQAANPTREPQTAISDQEEEEMEGSSRGFGFGFKSKEPAVKKLKHVDLESNSKSSRSRIHYHKFVKNKDLSKIKTEDWNCIFGKPVGDIGSSSKRNPQKETEQVDNEKDDNFSSDLFINRGSLRDYFKCKRAQKFIKPEYHEDDSTDVVFRNEEGGSSESPKKKGKNKYSKEDHVDAAMAVKQQAWEEWRASINDETQTELLIKKEPQEIVQESNIISSLMEEEIVGTPKKKRKKEKKPKKEETDYTALIEVKIEPETQKPKKKKDKKEKPEDMSISSNFLIEELEPEPQKKKKKKDKKEKQELQEEESNCNSLIEEVVEKRKKKKDKKIKTEDDSVKDSSIVEAMVEVPTNDEKQVDSSCSSLIDEEGVEPPKKKKKKDKNEKQEEESISDSLETKDIQEDPSSPSLENVELAATTTEDNSNPDSIDNKGLTESPKNTTEEKIEEDLSKVFRKKHLTAEEYHEAAKEFSGSNLLQIPGYRNQSNRF